MYDDDIIEPYICACLTAEEIRNEPFWFATLSDGINVYSKYNRRSWLELKEYLCVHTNKWITGLHFQFRDHIEIITTGVADYFFAHQADGWYGGPTYQHYLGGYRVGDKMLVKKFRVPEIMHVSEEFRELSDETVKKGLILSSKLPYGLKELSNGEGNLQ